MTQSTVVFGYCTKGRVTTFVIFVHWVTVLQPHRYDTNPTSTYCLGFFQIVGMAEFFHNSEDIDGEEESGLMRAMLRTLYAWPANNTFPQKPGS